MYASIREIIICSATLLIAATAGGWALARKLAGEDAGISFFLISSAVTLVLPAVQYLCWRVEGNRLLYHVLARIGLILCFAWFLSSLVLPLLWVDKVSVYAKASLIVFFVSVSAWSMWSGARQFREKWAAQGRKSFSKHYDRVSSSADWNKILRSLQLSIGLVVPDLSEKHNAFISVSALTSMLVGFGLRNVFPIFSIFAWGIPACIMVAYLMYMTGIGVGEILKIHEIEADVKRKIFPVIEK